MKIWIVPQNYLVKMLSHVPMVLKAERAIQGNLVNGKAAESVSGILILIVILKIVTATWRGTSQNVSLQNET